MPTLLTPSLNPEMLQSLTLLVTLNEEQVKYIKTITHSLATGTITLLPAWKHSRASLHDLMTVMHNHDVQGAEVFITDASRHRVYRYMLFSLENTTMAYWSLYWYLMCQFPNLVHPYKLDVFWL